MANKLSKWERSLRSVQAAQERAKNLISELERQGYQVRQSLKDLVYRPIKGRYTQSEAQNYRNLLQANRIRAAAKTRSGRKASQKGNYDVTQIPTFKHANISGPRYQEVINVRRGHETEDLARQFFKNLKYAMNKHPSQETDLVAWRVMKTLRKEGLINKNIKLKQGQLQKYINSLKQDDFVDAYVKSASKNIDDIESLRETFYGLGRGSRAAYENYRDLAYEQAKLTFGNNFKINRADIDKLYNFFSSSKAWNTFKKKFNPSEEEEADTFFTALAEATDKYNVTQLDSIFSQSNSADDVLKMIGR